MAIYYVLEFCCGCTMIFLDPPSLTEINLRFQVPPCQIVEDDQSSSPGLADHGADEGRPAELDSINIYHTDDSQERDDEDNTDAALHPAPQELNARAQPAEADPRNEAIHDQASPMAEFEAIPWDGPDFEQMPELSGRGTVAAMQDRELFFEPASNTESGSGDMGDIPQCLIPGPPGPSPAPGEGHGP